MVSSSSPPGLVPSPQNATPPRGRRDPPFVITPPEKAKKKATSHRITRHYKQPFPSNYHEDDDPSLELQPRALLGSPSSHKLSMTNEKEQAKKQKSPLSDHTAKSNQTFFLVRWMGHVLRCLFVDLPVWTCFAALCASIIVLYLRELYWEPQFQAETWNSERWADEFTYFPRHCTPQDQTAFSLEDPEVVFQPHDTAATAKRKMLTHGTTVYPNLLRPETAAAVRDFIVRQNLQGKDMIHVINNDNRFSFAIEVDQDPSVAQALEELLDNPRLVGALEAIIGPDPAVIEFTGITSTYGALPQDMHADVVPSGSAQRFVRNFVPSYSLFVPLQNTTAEMGATFVCPGTHQCSDGAHGFCEELAPQASGSTNNWPMGWGALVNQQTLHKGGGHNDPTPGHERVLFIITFAPRPRWQRHSVETRMLGTGGSYSLHWSQWGHTLSDFANPTQRMTYFWRHLRSFGFYLPSGRNWGWDFWTVTFQRVAQSELGYGNDYLRSAMDQGLLDWLPEILRGPRSMYDESEEDEEGTLVWKLFADTVVDNFVALAESVYKMALATFVVLLVSANCIFVSCGWTTSIWRPSRRLLWGHVVIALTALLAGRQMDRTTWARNLSRDMAFRTNVSDHSHYPDLPGTLVNDNDVLLPTEYRSDYLGSYVELLDHTHPGNVEWKTHVDASYVNYAGYTPSMRHALCHELTLRVGQAHGRFVSKNTLNQWSALTPSLSMDFCDKTLQSLSNPALGHAVLWTDYLLSEAHYGYWRQTRGLKYFTVSLLKDLQLRLLNQADDASAQHRQRDANARFVWPRPRQRKQPDLLAPRPRPQRRSLPPRAFVREPYLGLWSQVGDVVEAKYKSVYNEWYKGEVVSVSGEDETWAVLYQDGELDEKLCRGCLRPFVPFVEGEIVEWHHEESDSFIGCEILRIHPSDGTYDVKLQPDNSIIRGVAEVELRRTLGGNENTTWRIGDQVVVFWEEAQDEFVGEILGVYPDGMFDVEFDGGEIEAIPGELIVGFADEGYFGDVPSEGAWNVGDEVLALYPDMPGEFPGIISDIDHDGRFEIQYEDGDVAVISGEMILGPMSAFA